MENVEKELKELIQSRYKSLREFSIKIKMPYTTLDSIFKRGVANSSISNIISICEELGISADALANGMIVDVIKQKEPGTISDSGQREIYEIISSLSSENRSKLLELARLYLDSERNHGEKK